MLRRLMACACSSCRYDALLPAVCCLRLTAVNLVVVSLMAVPARSRWYRRSEPVVPSLVDDVESLMAVPARSRWYRRSEPVVPSLVDDVESLKWQLWLAPALAVALTLCYQRYVAWLRRLIGSAPETYGLSLLGAVARWSRVSWPWCLLLAVVGVATEGPY